MSRRSTFRAVLSPLPLAMSAPQGHSLESQLSTVPPPSREPSWEDLLGRR
jgi:hypothetical protein